MAAIIGNLPVTLQNGTIADASQLMADLNYIVNQVNANAAPVSGASGSLINLRVVTVSGTYTPTAGTNSIIAILIGGGGAGGGCPATGAGQVSAGGAGGSGAWGAVRMISGFSGVAMTIGNGGAAIAGGQGNAGGTTAFASVTAAGGGAGLAAGPASSVVAAGAAGGVLSGGVLYGSYGEGGDDAPVGSGLFFQPKGGSTPWGSGGRISAGTGFGAGGAGTINGANSGVATGFNGSQGAIIVFEYA
ncbi:hypothetical protein AB4Y42_05475 [Paraburkholderia sp. EG286B]|uniref:hypothetical protein n=1 Tax=Paraburkholderia sp. EG286B TaxID=3237011 RepID=UPI0034D26AC1